MKILRIIARLNVGGPARHVVWLTQHFSDKKNKSVLIAGTVPDGEQDMGYFARENHVNPLFIEEMSRELSIKDAISLIKIYREIRRFKPDIIHTHTAKAGTVGRVAAFFYKWLTPAILIGRPRAVRVIHTFHGHVFHGYYSEKKTRIFLAIEKLLARFATDRIIVISPQQLQEISSTYGVGRRSQFSVVPLGLDLAAFEDASAHRDEMRSEFGIGPHTAVLGFSGRLTEIKDVPLLLAAAKVAAIQSPLPLQFLILGDGSMRAHLEETAGENVRFLGNRHDVARVLSAFDIIALTSRNEGTPLSLIEAMASGIPFVSTAVGGVVDLAGRVVENCADFDVCERGVLVRSRDPKTFAAAVNKLLADDRMRLKMGADGQEFVRDRYSVERLYADIEQLYETVLADRS